jgi:HK97 family phage prohead protease
MPIEECSVDGLPGVKWGEAGACYTYAPGDEDARKEAVAQALAQGIAIGDIDVDRGIAIEDLEERAPEDIDLTPTNAMGDAARKGLELYAEGKGGDGLVEATIRDARRMASGEVLSEDKVRRIPAWWARHRDDWTESDTEPGEETPGYVAALLWGIDSTDGSPGATWASRKVEELDRAEDERRELHATGEEATDEEIDNVMETISDDRPEAERSHSPVPVEYRESGAGANYKTISGYAAVWGKMSEDLGGFREVIAPGAFSRALERGNTIKLLYDHQSAMALASTESEDALLELREDEIGLRVWARVDMSDPDVQRVAAKLRSGVVDQMSFAFSMGEDAEDEWDYTGGIPVRTIRSVSDLYEVSVVAFPAYTSTKVALLERARHAGRLPELVGATDVAPETVGGETRDAVSVTDPRSAVYWRAKLIQRKAEKSRWTS